MTEMVTGTPAIVGFTNGNRDNENGWGMGGYAYARAVDAGAQTRDLLSAIAVSGVAIEKTGAANSLAIEKIGAAGMLEASKNTSLLQLQAAQNHAALAAQIAACCCEQKELVREIESNRVRDQLNLLQTQFLILSGGQLPAVQARAA